MPVGPPEEARIKASRGWGGRRGGRVEELPRVWFFERPGPSTYGTSWGPAAGVLA